MQENPRSRRSERSQLPQNAAVSPRLSGDAALRRFALTGPPSGRRAELAEGEVEHARRVLRLVAGDRLLGLDGHGAAWPLVVRRADARAFEVECEGAAQVEPAPGEAGAPLPWIEIVGALPRGDRAEEMVDRLVQLGVAAIRPLAAERASPAARGENDRRAERLERRAREACKQSGRLWWAEIGAPETLATILARPARADFVLDPRAEKPLFELVATTAPIGTRERPLRIWVGPEGGFSPGETAALDAAGAARARLSPHVLRIETAAEAAAAVIVARASSR
jgi:16S rRNA (uracil1498-N3)-methyltransferase